MKILILIMVLLFSITVSAGTQSRQFETQIKDQTSETLSHSVEIQVTKEATVQETKEMISGKDSEKYAFSDQAIKAVKQRLFVIEDPKIKRMMLYRINDFKRVNMRKLSSNKSINTKRLA